MADRAGVSKWLRVTIPSVLVVIWLAIGGLGGQFFGKISDVAELDLAAFLPTSVESTEAAEIAKRFTDQSTENVIVAFERSKGNFDRNDTKLKNLADELGAVESVAEVSPPVVADSRKAGIIALGIEAGADTDGVLEELRQTVSDAKLADTDHYITGSAGFSADLGAAFSGIDGLLLIVALAVVFVILIFVYRSPILPIAVLMTSCLALAVAVFVVYQLASNGIVTINGQVQGILFILVIGAATDYSLLYVARFREELYRQASVWGATRSALRGSVEPILASGGTVIAGLLCLLLSSLESNAALGPVGAVGILLAMLAALTLLPSLLALLGRTAFWPYRPKADTESLRSHERQLERGFWSRLGRFIKKYPRRIWIGTTAALLLMCIGVVQLRADGMPISEFVLGYSEAREGQAVISRYFPAGQGTPTQVVVPTERIDEVTSNIEKIDGVESVAAVADGPQKMKPIWRYETELRQEIRQQIEAELTEEAGRSLPESAVDGIVSEAYPFEGAEIKSIDGNSVLQVTLSSAPDSSKAESTVKQIRQVDHTLVGGVTATNIDTLEASVRDRNVIIPSILVAITLILMVLLRSILAPILLTITTVISFGSAIGVSALVVNYIFGFDSADPSVVLYAFVFLVALGIDYNIFLMTRVREESLRIGTHDGVIRGLVVTGGVITSAGVVLASTFAALGVIPIAFLVQLAFIVAFGVLLDTLVVRSLLVPALVRDLGAIIWWPSKLRKKQ